MSRFRKLVAAMDEAIFDTLSDNAVLDGRPVRGMFSAPWLQPQIGTLRTGIIEPFITVRDADAAGVERGAVVTFDNQDYEIVSVEPDGTGVTRLVLRPR
jgi:hypothetical protein